MLVLIPLGRTVRAQNWDARQVAKIKTDVTKIAHSEKKDANIKLLNGTELNGQIGQASDREFTFTEDKTGSGVTVAYSDVSQVKRRGFSTARKIGIITALVGGLLFAAVALSRKPHPFKNGVLR
jgi:hypothetical protein